ncbi:dolichyl-phosphate beta-D-mannosyltransferase [Flavobacteriaceae bacterium UJ101]|nr:dolichyl-phosphate beta-D-mannosyltransferase [Flavobacteriaceae bacterium UJ101]
MDISIVIPLLNEAESLPELHNWIQRVMKEHGFSYEVIFIDDGSKDHSWKIIKQLQLENDQVKGIKFQRNFGKSQALNAAFKITKGDVIITMDADLQDSPEEIPELYSLIKNDGYDIVSGWKQKRYDNKLTKNLPSKLFNWAACKTSGIALHDFNCGLKSYNTKVIKTIDVYGEMHRYIPVLAKNAGFDKITEKVVQHQARKHGESKFGAERFINGFLDLISLWFIGRFGRRPMHLFGALGTLMFIIGFFSSLFIGISKLYKMYAGLEYKLITDNPWFYIALTVMILGTQLFLAGFLGEIIIQQNRKNQDFYQIEEKLNLN